MQGVSLERITVAIYGLTREGRANRVAERALLSVPGVNRAYVDSTTEMAYIEYDPTHTTRTQLLRAIERTGLRAGELNLRSVGSLRPFPTRCAYPDSAKREVPSILTDRSTAGLSVAAPCAAPEVSLSASRAPVSAGSAQAQYPRRQFSRLRILAGALGLVAILVALLWLSTAGQTGTENMFTVEVGAMGFRPVAIVVPAGKPVALRVRNYDVVSLAGGGSHQFAIKDLGINLKLQPGQTALITLRPLQPATYHYYCAVCCGSSNVPSMQGALIVH